MAKKKTGQKGSGSRGVITVGGNIPRPGQSGPNTIILTQPRRFGIDIADYTNAVRSAENVDFPRRYQLYDLYEDILMDTHLTSVIEKRRNAALCSTIEFRRDGKPDELVNEQIKSPWFSRLVSDILDARFWGFTLCQFSREKGWIDYVLVPRKHADPVRRIITTRQTDITGKPWDEYYNLFFVGDPGDLGLLAKAAPWVIYKRNTTGDWSQFSEVFGMPIQEYTYDTDDDSSRQRAIDDASSAGSLAVFVHGKDTSLNLLEAGNKTGSADVYERLVERCNSEISKLILGNTLTTEASSTGTQALGTVHRKGEDKLVMADRLFILNALNYEMADIFAALGINTAGGEFVYPEKKDIDPTAKINILTQLRTSFNLPVDDDWLYEEFGIAKPEAYALMKSELSKPEPPAPSAIPSGDDDGDDGNDPADDGDGPGENHAPDGNDGQRHPSGRKEKKQSFMDRVRGFFAPAPRRGGADLDW